MLLLHTLLRPIFLAAVVETGRTCKISTLLPVFSRLFSYWTSTSHRMETASRMLVRLLGPVVLLFGNMYRIVVVHGQERPKAGWSGRPSLPYTDSSTSSCSGEIQCPTGRIFP